MKLKTLLSVMVISATTLNAQTINLKTKMGLPKQPHLMDKFLNKKHRI